MLASAIQIKKRRGIFHNADHWGQPANIIAKPQSHQPNIPISPTHHISPNIAFHKQPIPSQPYNHQLHKSKRQQIWGNDHHDQQWQKNQAKQQQFSLVHLNSFDLASYIEQQVVQMEESPARRKIEELKKKGMKFEDARFPPNWNSLSGEWKMLADWKQVKWAKLSSVLPVAKIFKTRPQADHIKQGNLGNCYFLAGLAAICQRPDRIYNLFLTREQNEQKYYSMKMLYKGKWMVIDVDEYIPCQGNSPAFSKAIDDSLWVILLEKAWAKLYSSYKRIESGFPQETLHDLTGAPLYSITLATMDKEKEWKYLLEATRLEYAMVCSSNPGSDSETSQSGVVQGHAYTLLAVATLNFNGQLHRLVKLRNPWGKVEFKGQWSDFDPNWNYVDPKEKQKLGFKNDREDGAFFIGFDVFCAEFKSITVGQINDNASYVYKSAKDLRRQGCYFKLDIKKLGIYSLQVDKTPQRSFEYQRQRDYQYPRATVDIFQMGQSGMHRLKGFQNNLRTTSLKLQMKPGIYIVKVLVEFNLHYQTEFDVNLAVYAEYPCSIQLASNQQASMMSGKPVSWNGHEDKTPAIWNQQSAWAHKLNQNEEEAHFILDFNGDWLNSKPTEYVKGNEMPHKKLSQQHLTTHGGNMTQQQGEPTAWNALQTNQLSNIISGMNAGQWDNK